MGKNWIKKRQVRKKAKNVVRKNKRSNFIERDDDDDNNNRIDNNLDQSGNLPIGRIKKKNEINDNRKKFKGFKRKDN